MGRVYKREKVWYVDTFYKGRRVRRKIGASKRLAEQALKEIEAQIIRDEFSLASKDIKIEQLVTKFLEYHQTNNRSSTTKRYVSVLNHFLTFLRIEYPSISMVSSINHEIVEAYKSYRRNTLTNPNGQTVTSDTEAKEYTRKGARARTVNLEVDGIKSMLNLAVKWGYLKESPAKDVKSLKEDDRKQVMFLSKNECVLLLETAQKDVRPILYTFLSTGMRKSELVHLQWKDVDLKRGKIVVGPKENWKPKSGNREIPISDKLSHSLKSWKKVHSSDSDEDYVFHLLESGKSHNYLRRELIKIANRAGIKGLTKIHTLRHTFASHLVMSGVDLATVQRLLGHSDINMTMRYAHLAPEHLNDAVNKLPF